MKRGWLALMLSCLGCDGLGEPVVGKLSEGPSRGAAACMQPTVDCATTFTPRAPFPPPPPVVPACGGLSSAPCEGGQAVSCTLALRVVEGIPVTLSPTRCATLDLTPAPESDAAELNALVSTNSRIVLHAERPTRFVFRGVDLGDIAIELRGPVSLQLEGTLRDVSITSADAVQVTITGSVVRDLAAVLPAGSLRIQRGALTTSKLQAREVVLETVPITDVDVSAERVVGIELQGERMRLDVDDLSLSEVELGALELHRCDTALLVNARLTRSLFAGCRERLRAHSSSISDSRVNGTVESVAALWNGVHFGAGSATTLEMWGGTLTRGVFCPALTRLTLSEEVSANCNDCSPLRAPEQQMCLVVYAPASPDERYGVFIGGNVSCPVLDDSLLRCDPIPVTSSPL
ncbi:MAG TPA: hypothetical protein VFX59_22950 [Polyangiales bacterium]|nr:hypothetical protein [Polyangiales bacterium]